MKNLILILFLIPQLMAFGQGQVNCSLLQVTDVLIDNSNLTIDFSVYNGDTMNSHYPYIAYTIDNNNDTLQQGNISWFVTGALDTSWYHYNLISSISPSYPLTIYFVYSNLLGSQPGSDTCVLYYSQTLSIPIEIDDPIVTLFPNPSSDIIIFNFNYPTHGQIIFTDILGKQVLLENFNSAQVLFNLKRLKSKGTYFVNVLDFEGNILAIRKLIYK